MSKSLRWMGVCALGCAFGLGCTQAKPKANSFVQGGVGSGGLGAGIRRPLTPSDVDYGKLSDGDILNL